MDSGYTEAGGCFKAILAIIMIAIPIGIIIANWGTQWVIFLSISMILMGVIILIIGVREWVIAHREFIEMMTRVPSYCRPNLGNRPSLIEKAHLSIDHLKGEKLPSGHTCPSDCLYYKGYYNEAECLSLDFDENYFCPLFGIDCRLIEQRNVLIESRKVR